MKDVAYFCPSCGTSSVDVSSLAGGDASCSICGWAGKREDLLHVPLEHDFASQEEMVLRFIKQVAGVIAQNCAKDLGALLLKWGFLDEKRIKKELESYIRGMAVASAKSVIDTRKAFEVARVLQGKKASNDN